VSLSKIRRVNDPRKRASQAAAYLKERERITHIELAKIRDLRDTAAREMLALTEDGKPKYRPADVARTIGVTRAAVAQRFGPRHRVAK